MGKWRKVEAHATTRLQTTLDFHVSPSPLYIPPPNVSLHFRSHPPQWQTKLMHPLPPPMTPAQVPKTD
ncbi:hypothetical protein A0H81_14690 [Grifola frondosa]|uniref:Uncharacterized protein n=1 Tax=Grifola frondosa TaxID=5627 RepID=A0A1C7LKD9_GRIFR|nr:hypothetical protein A0H81_14690 [Grifola frondosa]